MSQPNRSEGAKSREAEWAAWMRAGLAGDMAAYRRLLQALTPALRGLVRRGLTQSGNADVEDVVQEVLLAVHLKRNTWMSEQPFSPWLNAIARHKLIDVLRRKGRRGEVPIYDLIDILPDTTERPETSHGEVSRLVSRLEGKQKDVVNSVSVDGTSIRDTAAKLNMSEGAVRVTLHRGLKKLAALYRVPEA
ncbi:MAG: sigma-70 family RNA polymerase sigma factor [Proteobacteria bacterium]|nr:sigma-70 family RNA polymerase sigma factor [Pseudomonadota bacterium]